MLTLLYERETLTRKDNNLDETEVKQIQYTYLREFRAESSYMAERRDLPKSVPVPIRYTRRTELQFENSAYSGDASAPGGGSGQIGGDSSNSTGGYVNRETQTEQVEFEQSIKQLLVKGFLGVRDLSVTLVFGVIIYLLDVVSDIVAGVFYFREGHPVWGLLSIAFVLLSAVCSAAVSCSWWYYYDREHRENPETQQHRSYRTLRMTLSVLLLDPLIR